MKKSADLIKHTGDFHALLVDSLKDPHKAVLYLQVALDEYQQDNDTEVFMLALRNVAEAHGGLGMLAKKTDITRQHLYHALSSKGNPQLNTLGAILTALGFHLSITIASQQAA